MVGDGLMHENMVLLAAPTRRDTIPVLLSDEPFPEHIFVGMSSRNTEEHAKDILRPVSESLGKHRHDDQHRHLEDNKPSFWDVVRTRSAEAKVLHSFVCQREGSSEMSNPTLVWGSTSCETRTFRDVHSDAFPASRIVRDLPPWKKAWLRVKQRTEAGMPASPETPRSKSRGHASPVATDHAVDSWHAAHPSPSSASAPLLRPASMRGLSSPPSRSSSFASFPEGPPASLTAFYHATRAKFPNAVSPTRAAYLDGPPRPLPLSAAPDSFNRNYIASPPHHAPAFATRGSSDGVPSRRTALARSSSTTRSAGASPLSFRRTALRAAPLHPSLPSSPERAPSLSPLASRTHHSLLRRTNSTAHTKLESDYPDQISSPSEAPGHACVPSKPGSEDHSPRSSSPGPSPQGCRTHRCSAPTRAGGAVDPASVPDHASVPSRAGGCTGDAPLSSSLPDPLSSPPETSPRRGSRPASLLSQRGLSVEV